MKMEISIWVKMIILLSGFVLTACSGITPTESENQPDATEVPVIVADNRIVSDGMLVPKEFVDLAFAAGGEVAEVLVEEGSIVVPGDVIARLSGR
jgi:multidrug efflux pump subunit AcrA (membrane-fusion protein)